MCVCVCVCVCVACTWFYLFDYAFVICELYNIPFYLSLL